MSFAIILCSAFFCDFTSYAFKQESDVEPTRLGSSQTYYSFNAKTKTITISGEGATPDFRNSGDSQPWYSWRSDGSVENLVVEEGITYIGNYMFYNTFFYSVSLPSTLKKIGTYAFSGVSTLAQLKLPKGVEIISDYAFYRCRKLVSTAIPDSVISIGANAFDTCSSLENIEFENMNMPVSIGKKAFYNCATLTEVTVPKGAKLSKDNSCFGYYKTNNGDNVYSSFVMNVYRDSDAYSYAFFNSDINYNIIGNMNISEGETVNRTFYSDSVDDAMMFYFTPAYTDNYKFYSAGNVDVDCILTDSAGDRIAENKDVSLTDSNFYILEKLNAGETYCFTVSSFKSTGDFSVTLYPAEIESLNFDFDTEFSCSDVVSGKFNVLRKITGKEIEVVYKRGFTETVTFENNKSFYEYKMAYTDDQNKNMWLCGNHTVTISFGDVSEKFNDVSENFNVTVNHSYVETVVEPTLKTDGYSSYRCYYCGDTYKDNFNDRLGVRFCGKAVLMENPQGECKENLPLSDIKVTADGETVFTTNETGEFEFYVLPGVREISFGGNSEVTRKIIIESSYEKDIDLGNVAICSFDYNRDGYINAKDFAVNNYSEDKKYWKYADNFFAYGKIDESIYNNI